MSDLDFDFFNTELTICPANVAADSAAVFVKKPGIEALLNADKMEEGMSTIHGQEQLHSFRCSLNIRIRTQICLIVQPKYFHPLVIYPFQL